MPKIPSGSKVDYDRQGGLLIAGRQDKRSQWPTKAGRPVCDRGEWDKQKLGALAQKNKKWARDIRCPAQGDVQGREGWGVPLLA